MNAIRFINSLKEQTTNEGIEELVKSVLSNQDAVSFNKTNTERLATVKQCLSQAFGQYALHIDITDYRLIENNSPAAAFEVSIIAL